MATAILSTVMKAFRVLDLFREHTSVNLAECAKLLDVPRSSAHRLLVTLVSTGMVDRTDDGRYELGMRMFEIGALAPGRRRLYEASSSSLEELVTITGMAAQLSVLDGTEVICLVRAHRDSGGGEETRAGSRSAAHATAAGKVLLADQDARLTAQMVARGLDRLTRHTVVVPSVFYAELGKARSNGMATEREELRLGHGSVAVPVVGSSGAAIAALSIGGPVARMNCILRSTGGLRRAAHTISLNLGRAVALSA